MSRNNGLITIYDSTDLFVRQRTPWESGREQRGLRKHFKKSNVVALFVEASGESNSYAFIMRTLSIVLPLLRRVNFYDATSTTLKLNFQG